VEQWLQSTFPVLAPDGVSVKVYHEDNCDVFYNPVGVATDFPGITGTPTYADLSALPLANWQPIFDQWKANGLVA